MDSFWKFCVFAMQIFILIRQPALSEEYHERAQKVRNGSTSLFLHQNNISRLDETAVRAAGFHNLSAVEHLTVMDAPNLHHVEVADLMKMSNLQTFCISQAPRLQRINKLPTLPKLRILMITNSGLVEVPILSGVQIKENGTDNNALPYLQAIDLDSNHIRKVPKHSLGVRADQVSLTNNLIEEVPAHVFKTAQISKLSFKGNTKLKRIHEHAFSGIVLLRTLDLSSTAITSLPTKGLEKLETLKIQNTPSLKYIPSIYEFHHLTKAYLTHHFHCCAFAFPEIHDPEGYRKYHDGIANMKRKCEEQQHTREAKRKKRYLEAMRVITHQNGAAGRSDEDEDTATTMDDYDSSSSSEEFSLGAADADEGFHDGEVSVGSSVTVGCSTFNISRRILECTPQPDALNPCEDVMGWSWLRASVWFVITAAIVGNVAVLLVLLTNHAEMTVPRFLMCHLAFSDLCTGLYLFMLAVVDLRSFGEFFNYAYDWQYGVGCKIAGFLSVYSGQLSVFTLTLLTLERWFAITYAINLERRICLSMAAKIMIGGWLFSIILASLPLFGVSDYSSTSICLPVESVNVGDAVYQGTLFLTSILAWFIIVVCYVQIYRSLGGGGEKYGRRGAQAAAERKIANKMALLIGTDLLCWAPVAFFGVTALAGVPLVDVSHGKVLLVFFYPLNACANPFLYAILTKQYRKDLLRLIARSGQCNWLVERYKLATNSPPTAQTNPSAPLQPLVDYQKSYSQTQYCKENGEATL